MTRNEMLDVLEWTFVASIKQRHALNMAIRLLSQARIHPCGPMEEEPELPEDNRIVCVVLNELPGGYPAYYDGESWRTFADINIEEPLNGTSYTVLGWYDMPSAEGGIDL